MAWDTTLVSRLRPDSPALAHVETCARDRRPVRVPSAVLTEAAYGLQRAAERDPKFGAQLEWLHDLARGPEIEVLALDGDAGVLAGRLRALQPYPPGRGSRDERTKPERRAAWLLDLQIAATAWTAGCDLATENRRDFELIARLLSDKLGLEPLGVLASPF